MNYSKIYSDFIADRRIKEPALKQSKEYVEKHHILPRCLGGGNEKANFISLTPEDHLFAHLLLARMHGGKLWAAVYAMCNLSQKADTDRRGTRLRSMFGAARRLIASFHSDIFSGADGPQADKAKYTLNHFDGRVASGNRFELEMATGVTRQQISAVLRGAKKNAHGWYCTQHNPMGLTGGELISIGIRNNENINLFHHDGRTWIGTRVDFAREFGAQLFFQTINGDVAGWHRTAQDASQYRVRIIAKAKTASDARGGISGSKNPNADKTIYKFLVIKTGEIVESTKCEAKIRFGVTTTGLCSLFNGRQTKTGGISLAQKECKET